MDRVHLGGRSACGRDAAALNRNDWSWIGGAGCVFFRKSFVVRSIRVSTMGLKHEPQLGPRLALASSCERIGHAVTFLPTASFRLRACLKRIGRNRQRYFWFSAYHATAAMKATTASTAKKILRTL